MSIAIRNRDDLDTPKVAEADASVCYVIHVDTARRKMLTAWLPWLMATAQEVGFEPDEFRVIGASFPEAKEYPAMNRPLALRHLTGSLLADTEAETIVVLDPDVMFWRRPPIVPAPAAQHYAYQRGGDPDYIEWFGRAQPIGMPYVLSRDLFREIVPLWVTWTERCWKIRPNWVAEMWGFAYAAADLGVEFTEHHDLVCHTPEDALHPIVHYCHPFPVAGGEWSKWGDWFPVPMAAHEAPRVGRWLLETLRGGVRA